MSKKYGGVSLNGLIKQIYKRYPDYPKDKDLRRKLESFYNENKDLEQMIALFAKSQRIQYKIPYTFDILVSEMDKRYEMYQDLVISRQIFDMQLPNIENAIDIYAKKLVFSYRKPHLQNKYNQLQDYYEAPPLTNSIVNILLTAPGLFNKKQTIKIPNQKFKKYELFDILNKSCNEILGSFFLYDYDYECFSVNDMVNLFELEEIILRPDNELILYLKNGPVFGLVTGIGYIRYKNIINKDQYTILANFVDKIKMIRNDGNSYFQAYIYGLFSKQFMRQDTKRFKILNILIEEAKNIQRKNIQFRPDYQYPPQVDFDQLFEELGQLIRFFPNLNIRK